MKYKIIIYFVDLIVNNKKKNRMLKFKKKYYSNFKNV